MAGQKQPLRCIRESFAHAVNAAAIGRNQTISISKPRGNLQTDGARRGRERSLDQLSARKVPVHRQAFKALRSSIIMATAADDSMRSGYQQWDAGVTAAAPRSAGHICRVRRGPA